MNQMRIAGLATGLDTDQIIRDLMRVERMPLDKLYQEREWVNWQRDALRDINLALTEFRDRYSRLRLQGTFNAYSIHSANSAVVTGSATASAVPGAYDLQVHQLAKVARFDSIKPIEKDGEKVTSSTKILAADEQATEFKIKVPAHLDSEDEYITIKVTHEDTYGSLARKINNAQDEAGRSLGLRASFDEATASFYISTREMGADQEIVIEDVDGDFVQKHILGVDATYDWTNSAHIRREEVSAGTYRYAVSGQNASITFDGKTVDDLTTNQVTVHGIQLNLLSTTAEDESVTIRVESDPDEVFELVKEFVESYNELIEDIDKQLNEPRYRDYPPLTEEQRRELTEREAELWDERAKSGLLRHDNELRSLLTNLRRALSDPVEGIGLGELRSLSEIGIQTGDYSFGGRLFIDEEQLRQAIAEKPDEVMNLFTRRAPDDIPDGDQAAHTGLGHRVYEQLNAAVNRLRDRAGRPGMTSADQSTLGKNLSRIDEQIDRYELRLQQVEERYWRQFTALEKAMNEMNQQSLWLQQTLFANMGGYSS